MLQYPTELRQKGGINFVCLVAACLFVVHQSDAIAAPFQ